MNIVPYMPQCLECSARDNTRFDFSNQTQPANGYPNCLGLCKPSIYHSMLLPEYTLVTEPVAVGKLECVPCNVLQSVACSGRCGDGYYYADGGCIACSTAQCPHGQYRELCPATSDARCMQCPGAPTGALPAANMSNHTIKALRSVHPHECPLRCANNYAW